jgi:hypothetical protein
VTYGPERLLDELRAVGHEADLVSATDGTLFVVIGRFAVPCGRFASRVIELGIQATPDFPRTVSSAIHVRTTPQLYDYGDTCPGVRNITTSVLGPEWRYWSHNFGWRGDKSARRLMSQINTVFANAQ